MIHQCIVVQKIAQKPTKMRQRNGSRPNATLDPTKLVAYHAIVGRARETLKVALPGRAEVGKIFED